MIWLILILGLILRVISLNQSFWLDEATSANVIKTFNFGEIITKFSPGDFHPPFYYLILKAWSVPFGISEISLRGFSILASLLTVYVVYLIGKQIKNKAFGQTVAILMATAPLFVYYSQEARMYAFETLIVSLIVFVFIQVLEKGKTWLWILLSFLILILGATDYLSLLIIPVLWMAGLVKKKNSTFFSVLALAHIPLATGFTVWAPYFAQQLSAGLSVRTTNPGWWQILGKAGLKETALLPVKFMIGRISFDSKILYAIVVLIIGALFGYLVLKSRKALKKNKILAFWLSIPILLTFVLSFKLSVFNYFRLIFVLPAFYLIVTLGLYEIKKKFFPLMFLALVFVNTAFSLGYLLNSKFQREDWRGLVSKVGDSPVVFVAKSQREAFAYYNTKPNIIEPENLNKNQKEIYLMRYVQDIFDPADLIRIKIEGLGYKKTADFNFNGIGVWKYEK